MPGFNKNTLLNERGVEMASVNKEVTQVRNSIFGFVVNLQISRQLSLTGMSCSGLVFYFWFVLEI